MKKCPLDILGQRPISFIATYTTSSIFHIELKGKSKKPKLEEDEEYWIPERYRIVNECIQYFGDYPYKMENPKWIEASKMKQDFSRYWIEVKSVKEQKLQDLDKKQAIKFGIPPRTLPYYGISEKPKQFRKSEELWRLKEFFNKHYDGDTWDDNVDVWLYEYVLHRVKPKYPNYLDKHMFEKVQ